MYSKESILKILNDAEIPYKEITDLDSFNALKLDENNFELRFAQINYITVTKDNVKLYFGISYKTYERTEEDEKLFYEDLIEAVKLAKEGCELVWENP